MAESSLLTRVAAIETAVIAEAPEIAPQVAAAREEVARFEATFDRASEAVRSGDDADAAAEAVSEQGNALIAAIAKLAAELAARSDAQEASGISYFFNMILITGVLAIFGGAVLLLGLAYLSRDFSYKIVEITNAMTNLADGNRNFDIDGADRQDEIGAMVRALDIFNRASKRMESWGRERSEKAEQELQHQQERERERLEAEPVHLRVAAAAPGPAPAELVHREPVPIRTPALFTLSRPAWGSHWRAGAALAASVAVATVVLLVSRLGAPGADAGAPVVASSGESTVSVLPVAADNAGVLRDPRLDEFLRLHQMARGGLPMGAPGGTLQRADLQMPVGSGR